MDQNKSSRSHRGGASPAGTTRPHDDETTPKDVDGEIPAINTGEAEGATEDFRGSSEKLEAGVSRKAQRPAMFDTEWKWLNKTKVQVPFPVSSDKDYMDGFGSLIWDNEATKMMSRYDATPDELAVLSSETGWIQTCHLDWVADQLNQQCTSTMCFCLDSLVPGKLQRLKELKAAGKLDAVKRLTFAMNVGHNQDGSVFIADSTKSGNHWCVAIVNLDEHVIIYGDSLGHKLPGTLMSRIFPVLLIFIRDVQTWSAVPAHVPTEAPQHVCEPGCKSFPLQACGSVCGVVAIVVMAASAVCEGLFDMIMSPRSSNPHWFLLRPTRYNNFLRRQIIKWFVTGIVDVDFAFVTQKSMPTVQNTQTVFSPLKRYSSTRPNTGNNSRPNNTDIRKSKPNPGTTNTHKFRPNPYTQGSRNKITLKPKQDTLSEAPKPGNHGTTSTKNARPNSDPQGNTTPKKFKPNPDTQGCTNTPIPKQDTTTSEAPKPDTANNNTPAPKQDTTTTNGTPKLGTECNTNTPTPKQDTTSKTPNTGTECNTTTHTPKQDTTSKTPKTGTECNTTTHTHKQDTTSKTPNTGTATTTNTSAKTKSNVKSVRHVCPYCSNIFTSRPRLLFHTKTLHPDKYPIECKQTLYPCTICHKFSFLTMIELCTHYKNVHAQNVTIREEDFKSMNDFKEWKEKIEIETLSNFVKPRGAKKNATSYSHYFNCNRSGKPRIKSDVRKRTLKIQGSCKINITCSAFIRANCSTIDGSVKVNYCTDHVGHEIEMAHLRLSDDLRNHIAAKLQEGVEPHKLLNDIRNTITKINRDTLLTQQDILNIRKQYNISHTEKNALDAMSTHLWVQQLEEEGTENPIIYYKPGGTVYKTDNLKTDDFLLCIQTPFQREMMNMHAGKIICIDSTHNTTQYGFQLITLLVVDDYQESIPVAWAIANREDEGMLAVFFTAIKSANSNNDTFTKTFKSDLAQNFYNAWCHVFSKPEKRLYCSWHVDKAWQRKINNVIKTTKEQAEVYAYLKIVQMQTNLGTFNKQLQEFLAFLQIRYKPFHDYFYTHYVSNQKVHLWATCHRLGCLANTNMYAEAFHTVLKTVYFNSKQNRRIDYLLHILLKYARNNVFEHLIKAVKGKVTFRTREIRKRHAAAIETVSESYIEKSNTCAANEWLVRSTQKGNKYIVTVFENERELCKCKLRCISCGACNCSFSCQCPDFLTHNHITCKHIHALKMKLNQNKPNAKCIEEKDKPVINKNADYYAPFIVNNNIETDGVCTDNHKLKNTLLSRIGELKELVHKTQTSDALKAILQNVNSALKVGKGLEDCAGIKDLEVKEKVPPNKNNVTQRNKFHFTKTKKKLKTKNKLFLPKPNAENISCLSQELNKVTPTICGLCHNEDDNGISDDIEWITCSTCEAWVHTACDEVPDADDPYICSVCRI